MTEQQDEILTIITFLIIGVFIAWYTIVDERNKKKIQENPRFFMDLVKKWSPYFSPMEIAVMSSHRSDTAYILYLAELAKQNIIKINPDCQYIAYPVNFDVQTWQGQIINILDICRQKFEKRGCIVQCDCGYWILPIQALSPHLGDTLWNVRDNIVAKLIRQKVHYIENGYPEVSLRMLKKDIHMFGWLPHPLPKIDFLQIVNDNSNPLLPILYVQKYSRRMWFELPEQCDDLTKIISSGIGYCKSNMLYYAFGGL